MVTQHSKNENKNKTQSGGSSKQNCGKNGNNTDHSPNPAPKDIERKNKTYSGQMVGACHTMEPQEILNNSDTGGDYKP